MGNITPIVAAAGVVVVLLSKPVRGLALYAVLSMWYPYVVGTLQLGTIDFSVGRIVIVALLAKILIGTDLANKFKFMWLDRLVVILFAAEIVAGLTTTDAMELIEYRMGDFFDMALPYFAVRLILKNRDEYVSLLKVIAWSAGILGIFGFYESLTGRNLLLFGRVVGPSEIRLTYFYRAFTTMRHAIYYGVFSGMVGGLCLGLWGNVKRNASLYKVLIGLVFLGSFSSMSSGGLMAMIGALSFVACYRYRQYWRTAVVWIIVMCCVVEIVSNRHFYDVVDRFAFNSATAWYRGRLFEVAFFEGGMSGHWITGYGFEDPGWGPRIDMRQHTDMVNHYIMKLVRYGLVGFIPFCAVIVSALMTLFRGFWSVANDRDTWLIWCLAAGLWAVLLAFNSVSLFGSPMVLLFIMFGFCGVLPSVVERRHASRGVMPAGKNRRLLAGCA